MTPPSVSDIPGFAECMFCGSAILTSRAFEQVVGFIRTRSDGGANQITLQNRTGRRACSDCVNKLKMGIHPLQQPLWRQPDDQPVR